LVAGVTAVARTPRANLEWLQWPLPRAGLDITAASSPDPAASAGVPARLTPGTEPNSGVI